MSQHACPLGTDSPQMQRSARCSPLSSHLLQQVRLPWVGWKNSSSDGVRKTTVLRYGKSTVTPSLGPWPAIIHRQGHPKAPAWACRSGSRRYPDPSGEKCGIGARGPQGWACGEPRAIWGPEAQDTKVGLEPQGLRMTRVGTLWLPILPKVAGRNEGFQSFAKPINMSVNGHLLGPFSRGRGP